ncbi:MAG: beta-galactosidase [Clostridia bacterium]|nr:beta-galactosidase [Clostridia bacterium]
MNNGSSSHIVYGGDYNPDQWIKTKEVWDEDIRLMKLAHINSATVGIFAWSLLEPQEGVFDFDWLDEIVEKLYDNGISVILATPSGARPPWLSEKYPEVLRVEENGIRNEYGVRHNHCLTSPVYREKVSIINRKLAEHFKGNPAIKMWHISNEYSGECHCPLCQEAFRKWLKKEYHNDINELNDKWWGGFWSHNYTDFSQINSPKSRGENHVSALKLCWKRFVTDSHISFYENEIAPLRELTPDIPVTTNFMNMYDGIDYQKFASHVDTVSWDNYPDWSNGNTARTAINTAFAHDVFRSTKGGKPFYMMESTPSVVNWRQVNKIPSPGTQEITSIQALAYGSDSVQYFQWRKSRGGHEKYHGAVVGHDGTENTRVFSEAAHTGEILEKLSDVAGKQSEAEVAIICDWENKWATDFFCGYNNNRRDYFDECKKWYIPFYKAGITVDIIPEDADYSGYKVIIAPFLYMLKDQTEERITSYIKNGGCFVSTYLFGVTDKDDRCFLGGFPANGLKDVFGISVEETDALPDDLIYKASFGDKFYDVRHICDIIRPNGAQILGEYKSDFYSGTPCVTFNKFDEGKAYCVAFRNEGDFARDFCSMLIESNRIKSAVNFNIPDGIGIRKRGDFIFVMNFSNEMKIIPFPIYYTDVITGELVFGKTRLEANKYLIVKEKKENE